MKERKPTALMMQRFPSHQELSPKTRLLYVLRDMTAVTPLPQPQQQPVQVHRRLLRLQRQLKMLLHLQMQQLQELQADPRSGHRSAHESTQVLLVELSVSKQLKRALDQIPQIPLASCQAQLTLQQS